MFRKSDEEPSVPRVSGDGSAQVGDDSVDRTRDRVSSDVVAAAEVTGQSAELIKN